MHLSFTLMKKVVKFVVSNIVLGINYSCPVFLLYFFFLIMYNHLLLLVLINLYRETSTRKVNANQPYKHDLVVWLNLLYFLGYLVPNSYLCSVCFDGIFFFFSHFLLFGRIEDTDDPETNLLVNRIHFGKMFAPCRKLTKQSILILSFSTHFNLLHQR